MKAVVYIETTIPSVYYDMRQDPETVARQHWTRHWWEEYRADYVLVSSAAVYDELARGAHPAQEQKMDFIKGLSFLEINTEVKEIAKVYIKNFVMPRDASGDALHLAIASYYKVDFLLTWNCTHLANANKLGHIQRVNGMLGLGTPVLLTPLNLMGESYDR